MDSGSESDFDSEESLEFIAEYSDVDRNTFLGKGVAIWTFSRHDTLLLFNPRPDDALWQITQYVESKFEFDRENEKIMIMEGGDKFPKDIKDIFQLQPGSVIMIMPKKNLSMTVEINQLKLTLPISADPMCTVHEVKSYIKRVKGISIDQQDIIYKDRVLENGRRLYEYKVKNGTIMHVLIQIHSDLLINVETFWGKTYRLYIDRCSTGSDLIYRVFGRTFSRHGTQHVTVHELYVPIHVLVFQHNKRSLHWDYCLGFYGIKNGDTLVLNTVGRHNNMNMQTMLVITELGENIEITVSQFDRWSVVAFIVHGHTDVPVDLIRLYKKEVQLDFTKVIGSQAKNTVIVMNITMTNVDKDMLFGIPLKIAIGHGIVENIKVLPSKKVKDVKERLEKIGVPNATAFELGFDNFKLPDNAILQDVITDFKKVLQMKVERYPIFLHSPDGIIYKTMVDVNQDMRQLQQKIELKSGHAISSCRLLMGGQQLHLPDNANLYESGISIRNSIFIESASMFETFFITTNNMLVKLRVPVKPTSDMIKRSVWTSRDLPEGSITCLQTFLFWFFAPRVNRKYQIPRRFRRRKRLPAARVPLHTYSDRQAIKETADMIKMSESHAEKLKRKPNLHIPALFEDDTIAKDTQTQRTWPIRLQRPVRPKRNVEDWINATVYEPKIDSTHTRTPTRKKVTRHEEENLEPQRYREKGNKTLHRQTPRWVSNLQRTDTQGILQANPDGKIYRRRPKHNYFETLYEDEKSRDQSNRLYNQGDGSTARYLHTKRSFDRQDLVLESTDKDDKEMEDIFERPHVVLR
ncbi:hypothetical protein DPMN_000994 [Dreissena polymorpha]|nr:hypothetical protein DPMN_000994 [Dreissena polymorpha]